jgi:ParB-like nuclease domain.
MGNNTQKVSLSRLQRHPTLAQNYPRDKDRKLNINNGIRNPPKVTQNSNFTTSNSKLTIISGHRRVESARKDGRSKIEVEFVNTGKDKKAEQQLFLDYNDYRDRTRGEKVYTLLRN